MVELSAGASVAVSSRTVQALKTLAIINL